MQNTEDTLKDAKEDKHPKKLIGEKTYALGKMGAYGWGFVLSVTAILTTIAMIAFRPSNKKYDRDWFIRQIKWPVNEAEKRYAEFKRNHKVNPRLEEVITVATAAGVLAHFAKYLLQIPASYRGYRQARRANEKYEEVVDERDELLDKLSQYEGKTKTTPQTTLQITTPAITQKSPIPATGMGSNPAQEKQAMVKADGVPSGHFASAQKPADSHVEAAQRKDTSPLIGAGV